MKTNQIKDEACFVELVNKLLPPPPTHHSSRITNDQEQEQEQEQGGDGQVILTNQLVRQPSSAKPSPSIDFISQLPIEISIYLLLSLGDDPRTLVRCRLVSKYWKQCAEDPLIWREMFMTHSNWTLKYHSTNQSTHRSRQNSNIHNASSNQHVARRLSQLLLSEQPRQSNNNDYHHFDTESLISLDWIKLYRDRFILDQRWNEGQQTTRSLKGHRDSIYCLQLNGDQIITGSRDRTIKTWDMKTGTCTNTLTGHKGSVLCIRTDGSTMLTGSSDCQVFVWEEEVVIESDSRIKKWKVGQKLIGHQSGVLDLGLNEKYIVSCSKDTTVRIWNREDGGIIRIITGHTGPVNALELCKKPLKWIEPTTSHHNNDDDNRRRNLTTGLLTASGDSTMKLWELETGRLVRTFHGHIRGLACLKLVEDNHLVVTGSNDETIKFWNLVNGQCLKTLMGHSGLVRSLSIDHTQNRLVSGSYDKTIKVWDLNSGDVKLDFRKGERRLVFDVKVHLTCIVLVGYDSSIMILDFSSGLDCDNFL